MMIENIMMKAKSLACRVNTVTVFNCMCSLHNQMKMKMNSILSAGRHNVLVCNKPHGSSVVSYIHGVSTVNLLSER